MSKMRFVFLALFCLVLSIGTDAQNYPVLHYTVDDGLPSNVTYSVFRDSKGYIWIGTDKGVARTNGLKFEQFTTSNGLPDNEIFFVQEDRYGRIWLGTFNGALCYYDAGVFHTAANTPSLVLPYRQPHIRYISNEYDSSIIISYDDPRRFLVIKNGYCKLFDLTRIRDTAISNNVIFGKKITNNRYRIICKNKLVFIDSSCTVLEVRKIDTGLYSNGFFTSCQDQDYIYNAKRFFNMNLQVVNKGSSTLLRPGFLHQIYTEDNNVWYATRNGLYLNDSSHLLKDNNVSGFTRDNRGNYWVSTLNNGIFEIRKDYADTRYYSGLYNGVAKYAAISGGELFFTTTVNDLFHFDGNEVKLIFSYAAYKRQPFDAATDFGFYIDDGWVYYSSYNNNAIVVKCLLKKKDIKGYAIEGIKEIVSAGKYLYFRMPHYISRVAKSDFCKDSSLVREIKGGMIERIFCMVSAPDSSVWFSTIRGLSRINDKGIAEMQMPFRGVGLKSFIFFSKYILGYTHDNQLLVYNNNGGKVIVDTIAPRNCIWDKFYVVDSTHVLLSTNNNYRMMSLQQDNGFSRFAVWTVENSILPVRAEAICTDGNKWYFFKHGSMTVVGKEALLQKSEPPKVYFTMLKTGKHSMPVEAEMSLPYNEGADITLSFSSISYSAKEIIHQYSLSRNGEDNWIDVKGYDINLINTGAGNYTIKLRARTLSSGFAPPVVFKLHILNPFWLSWWFIALGCVCLAIIAGWVIRYRIHYLLRRKERAHALELKFLKSEYKALNALMNPHFIFNTLNNVQGLVNRNDKLAANEYIRVFADLIRQNMHNISKETITLQSEINLVANYLLLEKLRFKDHLNYIIDVAEDVDLSEIQVPPLLVQPLVENSIKHGILPMESAGGQVRVHIFEQGDVLVIEVSDNGVGLYASAGGGQNLHESYGLDNIRKRISQLSAILNKQILFDIGERTVEDGIKWTVVTITMPV